MFEILEKIILAGVGLANMTKEKAEKLVDTLIAKGQVKAKDKKAVLGRILRQTEQLDKDLEKKIKDISVGVVKSSQRQIDILNKKLTALAKELKVAKQGKKKTAKAKKTKKAKVKSGR